MFWPPAPVDIHIHNINDIRDINDDNDDDDEPHARFAREREQKRERERGGESENWIQVKSRSYVSRKQP